MKHAKSYPLWEAVDLALDHARSNYKRRNAHVWQDPETWNAHILETTVTLSIKPGMTQLLTLQFNHRVVSRSFIYYYSLRRQHDDTYKLYDVNAGRHL